MNLLFLKMIEVKIKMEIEEIKKKLKDIEDMVNVLYNKNNIEIKKVKAFVQDYLIEITEKNNFNVYITYKYCIINIFFLDISMINLNHIINILIPFKYYFDNIDWHDRFCDIKFIKGE